MNQLIERFIAESTICQGHPQIDGTYFDKEKFAELVRQDEREACAKLCEELGMATNGMYERNHECAQAIRARGEK